MERMQINYVANWLRIYTTSASIYLTHYYAAIVIIAINLNIDTDIRLAIG